MSAELPAIAVTGLARGLGGRPVLCDVEFTIPAGQAVALVGANGAGKTTLLRCLAGVLRPDRGAVRWFGELAWRNPPARRLIGMVAHESLLYPQLSLRENLVFAARMQGVAEAAGRADELLAFIGLARHAERPPTTVSKGMRQRLAIARALVHDPRILLLDEPFSGLDADGTTWLCDLFDLLREHGRTLCFALHDAPLVQRLADRVLRIVDGRTADVPLAEALPRAA